MEIVRLEALDPQEGPAAAVTVGNFDGVHRGHGVLLEATLHEARSRDGIAVALTFDPHPARVLSPGRAPTALMTLAQKAEILESLGLDRMAVLPFSSELARQTAAQFAARVLTDSLGARAVVVGRGFRFGRGRMGDVPTLETLGSRLGFVVRAVEPVLEGGEPVSSSRIRTALAEGRVDLAAVLLGRRFALDGVVVRGQGRGRGLGAATANLRTDNETLPAVGVYAAWARVGERGAPARAAVVNVGRRPTFEGRDVLVEAHVLDGNETFYGRPLRLEFETRLRDEIRFPGPEALAAQIREDVGNARRILVKP
jgi:riboflavin kinase/FMN adenylyltransferase